MGYVRHQVLGLLVWALIADTPYHLYPAYGWVMFVAVFLWLVTIVFFILYLFQLHMKLYMVPWPLVLMIFNVAATILYITAFITCSAAVDVTSLKGSRQYNQRAAASRKVTRDVGLSLSALSSEDLIVHGWAHPSHSPALNALIDSKPAAIGSV
ncbi:plasmolipin isoform X3 [Castor canadensis]|uniref:Plasmolipin isoform X3 n=1 Tax=Castor canadensis TaxID=51338 RepID=A0AC58L4G6_CASCN